MRSRFYRAAALVAVVLGGAGAGDRAEAAPSKSRRNKVVEAVKKTRRGIVTVKVEKRGNWGRKEVVGTGVIVDERGYVVTNHHVVTSAEQITVHLHDGTAVRAKVHTDDPRHDLAILHLPGQGKLQALAFAPGSDLEVGEDVIAIGHPFGYTNTVSTGIISALGREITMPTGDVLTNLIQTNASINPGNSGGPLLNIDGELIGINVALREGAQGIAFALNADTVQAVLSRHLSARKVAQVGHGLTCRERVEGDDESRQKVVVQAVAASSPARQAGIRPGDVIVRVAGRAVANRFDLERALWGHKPGDQVVAAIRREGKETRVSLTLSGQAGVERMTSLPARDGR
jgi:serine protease Do